MRILVFIFSLSIFSSSISVAQANVFQEASPTKVVAGATGTCAIVDAGDLYCWGYNQFGVLGVASLVNQQILTPTKVLGLPPVADVSMGYYKTCAVTTNRQVYCWGKDSWDSNSYISAPKLVQNVSGVAKVAVSDTKVCATSLIDSDKRIFCWSNYEDTAVGGFNGLTFKGVLDISAGSNYFCILYNDNIALALPYHVRCFGQDNWYGYSDTSLWGDANGNWQSVSSTDFRLMAVGSFHACGSSFATGIFCWGRDKTGDTASQSIYPNAISLGGGFSCALDQSKKVWCWGSNSNGQLGRGTADYQPHSVASVIPNFGSVSQISAGIEGAHICAISNSRVYCWGSNFLGQVGDGTVVDKLSPTLVSIQVPVGPSQVAEPTIMPRIMGSPTVGSAINVEPGEWEPEVSLSYQWLRDGEVIDGATSRSYEPSVEDFGRGIGVAITGSKPGLANQTVTVTATQVVGAGSISNQGVPKITGIPNVGETLGVNPGTWDVGVSFGYQWLRNGVTIVGATNPSYVLTSDDYRSQVSVQVSANELGFNPAQVTSESVNVGSGTIHGLGFPSIRGMASIGSSIFVSSDTPSFTSSFKWKRDGVFTGVSGSQYNLGLQDLGSTITVTGTYSKNGYQDLTLESSGTTVSTSVPNTACSAPIDQSSWASTSGQQPTIAGVATFGSTLKGSTGSWTSGTKFCTYWFENGKAIVGALSSSYKIQSSDIGSQIYYVVVGTDKQGKSVLRYSNPVSITKATLTNAVAPTISGQIKVGSSATAHVKAWNTGVTYSYQWLRNGLPISSATNSTYAIQAADVNQNLTVKVCGSKPYFDTVCMTSTSPKIVGLGTIPTAAGVAISGASFKAGATLSGSSGNWMQGVTLQQQWLLDGNPIPNATGSTYGVQASDKGHTISFQVTASADGYQTVVKTSIGRKIS